jgi:hypothetical protein
MADIEGTLTILEGRGIIKIPRRRGFLFVVLSELLGKPAPKSLTWTDFDGTTRNLKLPAEKIDAPPKGVEISYEMGASPGIILRWAFQEKDE